ncbi:MAG TPA: T9SS type A sorting domain-containing protein, partial [Candidatus Kapabacteria bacterium]|nr:T9SS type A sorting domain-containing protein [Candidatus Kapabacteria bacterium]
TTIPITGVVTGSKFKATVNVASETVGAVKPNDTMMKDFEVVLQDTVFDSLDMNKLSLLIRFDGDLLFKPNYLQLDTGWTVDAAHTYQDKQGLHLTLLYSGTSKHFTGFNDTILKVAFLAAVSDSNGTVAYADSAHFNDSTFEACTLKALNGSGTAPFSIDTSCSTAIIERALPDNLQPYTGIEVIPNPAHKDGSGATLHFTSNVSVPMTVDVLNVLGNSVAQLANGPVEKGEHALAIPTNEMPEGAYFVRISANGYTVVRKFVLEKE